MVAISQAPLNPGSSVFPFNNRVTLDQASKMLRSDILWVHFEFSQVNKAPPPGVRNAFEVLKKASVTKSSLPTKYSKPVNGLFQLFNRLVDLCSDSRVFFRYVYISTKLLNFSYLIIFRPEECVPATNKNSQGSAVTLLWNLSNLIFNI